MTRFDHHNVRIHGIRPEQVAGLPRFGELFPEIGAFIGGDVLAAHNAAFDLGVIRSGLEVSGLSGPAYDYVCTVMLSRRCYSLVSNSLPYAAEEAGRPAAQPPRCRRGRPGLCRHPDRHRRPQRGSKHRGTVPVPGPGGVPPAGVRPPARPAVQGHPGRPGGARRGNRRPPPGRRVRGRVAGGRPQPGAQRRRQPRTTRCSARPSCSPANWQFPAPKPRSVPPSLAPGPKAG